MLRLQTYFQGRSKIHRLPVLQGTPSFVWILALYRRDYQAGHCEKGKRCKFSHDLNVNRKAEKIDVYSDARKDKETGESSRARRDLLATLRRHDGQMGPGQASRGRRFKVGQCADIHRVSLCPLSHAPRSMPLQHRLQVLYRGDSGRQIWLVRAIAAPRLQHLTLEPQVLDLPKRRQGMQVPARPAAWLRLEAKGQEGGQGRGEGDLHGGFHRGRGSCLRTC
jgi:hypothetical protein